MPDEGKWVTIKGVHIFLKKGQTVEQAFAELGIKQDKAVDDIVNSVNYVQMQPWVRHYYDDDYKYRIPPKKHAQRVFRRALEKRVSTNDDELIIMTLKNNVDELILKDTYGSSLTWTSTWDKGRIIRLHLSINGTRIQQCSHFMHEIGHAIDMHKWGHYLSSEYVSPKHGTTMAKMLFQEIDSNFEMEYFEDEVARMESKRRHLDEMLNNDKMTKQEYSDAMFNVNQTISSLCDVAQGYYGDKLTKEKLFQLGHKAGYYDEEREFNAGTELFAELTECKNTDKDKEFYNIMKQYCPKTVEIYEEIMEERRNAK